MVRIAFAGWRLNGHVLTPVEARAIQTLDETGSWAPPMCFAFVGLSWGAGLRARDEATWPSRAASRRTLKTD